MSVISFLEMIFVNKIVFFSFLSVWFILTFFFRKALNLLGQWFLLKNNAPGIKTRKTIYFLKSFFLYVTLTEATLLWRSSPWPAVAWITWAVLLSLATINFGDGRDINQKRKRQTRTLAAIIFIAATVLLFVQVL